MSGGGAAGAGSVTGRCRVRRRQRPGKSPERRKRNARVVYRRGHVRRVARHPLLCRGLLGGDPGRRCGHPAVAAVPRRGAQVPPRPDRDGALAAAVHLGPAGAAVRRPRHGGHRCAARGRGARRSCRTCRPANLLAEPSPRDSMAAIGLAAAVLERARPGAVIGSFAADHVIGDADGLPRLRPRGGRGGPAGLRRHDRHRADPSGDRVRLHPRRRAAAGRGRPARARGRASSSRSPTPRRRRVPRDGRVPLERRDVRRPGVGAARPAGDVPARAGAAACAVARGGARSGWTSCGRG